MFRCCTTHEQEQSYYLRVILAMTEDHAALFLIHLHQSKKDEFRFCPNEKKNLLRIFYFFKLSVGKKSSLWKKSFSMIFDKKKFTF